MNKAKSTKHWKWLGSAALLVWAIGMFSISPAKAPVAAPSTNLVATEAEPPMDGTEAHWAKGHANQQASHAQSAGDDWNGNAIANITSRKNAQAHTFTVLDRRARHGSDRPQEEDLSMPEWEKVFLPDGSLLDAVDDRGMFGSNGLPDFIDLYSGIDAEFVQENFSAGVATDMSALLIGRDLNDEVLYNGAVRAEHDLGNGYLLATVDEDNHLRIYAAVERLITDSGTFIEFEFNQKRVQVASGSPWPIIGERTDGDVMVRMVFSGRSLQSVELDQWRKGGYEFIDSRPGIAGNSCLKTRGLMYCDGPPPILHPDEGFEVWDENFQQVDTVLPDELVEVGIDVELLIGPGADIRSVLFRTPEDIALSSLDVFDQTAQSSMPSGWDRKLVNRALPADRYVSMKGALRFTTNGPPVSGAQLGSVRDDPTDESGG